MADEPTNPAAALRGATRLTVDAVVGVTDLVESMHRTVLTAGGKFGDANSDRMPGVTGLVFWNVRAITGLVGAGLEQGLGLLAERVGKVKSSSRRLGLVAAVNGVLGDYLEESGNPLALPMTLRRGGERVEPGSREFREALERANGRLLLLAHGSAANDLMWDRGGHDHGEALAEELGVLPVYLRYNSGRHVSQNGRELAHRLESFLAELPESVQLSILAHSMGGLLARSAFHYGRAAGHAWPRTLETLVFLGTPHHGAPLERSGNWVDMTLQSSPYTAPLARLGKIRSAGVTDLRWGNVLDADWEGRDRFERTDDPRRIVPLPEDVACFAIAGSTAERPVRMLDRVVGDGLVPVDSALGRHEDPARTLDFPAGHRRVVRGTGHLGLLGDAEVYETIVEWIT